MGQPLQLRCILLAVAALMLALGQGSARAATPPAGSARAATHFVNRHGQSDGWARTVQPILHTPEAVERPLSRNVKTYSGE